MDLLRLHLLWVHFLLYISLQVRLTIYYEQATTQVLKPSIDELTDLFKGQCVPTFAIKLHRIANSLFSLTDIPRSLPLYNTLPQPFPSSLTPVCWPIWNQRPLSQHQRGIPIYLRGHSKKGAAKEEVFKGDVEEGKGLWSPLNGNDLDKNEAEFNATA